MTNLINKVKAEYNKEREEVKNKIENNEDYCRKYLTENQYSKYTSGVFTKEKIIELATKKAFKKIDAEEQEKISKIENIEKSGVLESATITIEWKKSATWGSNPTAEISYSTVEGRYNRFQGSSIGGCGYDKESTAAAQVLNQCYPALKLMYKTLNNNIESEKRNLLGYGSGYGVLPYFEGGVGINCFHSIFEKLGYKWETVSSGKTFDVYRIALK